MGSLSYKKTNIDFIGDIPLHWNIVKLKVLSDIINGFAFSSQDFSIDNKIPVIRIGDIKSNLDLTKCVCIEKFDEYKDFLIKKGDILFAMTGATIGKNAIYKSSSPSLLNQRVCIFRSKINADQDFLGNCIGSCFFKYQVDLNCVGGAQANIGREDLMNFYIPYPPLNEQKLISQYLDKKTQKIDSLIKKIETKIELLKEQKTALINQYVTKGVDSEVAMRDSGINWIGKIPRIWEISKIKYLTSCNDEVLNEKTDPNYSFHYIEVGDVNFENGILIKEKIQFKNSPSRARRVIRAKDVIISTVRTYLRSISIVPDIPDLICSTGFCVLRSKNRKLLPDYLSYFVKTTGFVQEVVKNSYGVSYPAINSIDLIEFNLLLPPFEEQRKIVERISYKENLLKKIIEKSQKKVNLLIEYRQSLISSVVTGKIRVTQDMI